MNGKIIRLDSPCALGGTLTTSMGSAVAASFRIRHGLNCGCLVKNIQIRKTKEMIEDGERLDPALDLTEWRRRCYAHHPHTVCGKLLFGGH